MDLKLILELILFPLIFCFAEHFTGGGFGWDGLAKANGGPLPGRSLYWASIPVLLGTVLFSWHFTVIALGWIVYRSFAWKMFGGSETPQTLEQCSGLFCRHLISMLVPVIAFFFCKDWWHGTIAVMIYSGIAAALGHWVYVENNPKSGTPVDVIPYTEIIRGFLFGIVFLITCL